ncbi:MAG: diaminopimelate dehydrogenase [Bacteroidetes bacterium]|nr:diaminopimelate dehydrogenase [Bacteroidota bacterium]
MSVLINVAIVGYGNVGRGTELAITQNPDIRLVAILTRRSPGSIRPHLSNVPVYPTEAAIDLQGAIDVAILCGGSATDLIEQGPYFTQYFNVVDSFDTHARIPEYFTVMDDVAKRNSTLAIISTGWDPGLFSIARVFGDVCIPNGKSYTFWGPGISQGHSDAIRRVKGVKDARQYTIPLDAALQNVRSGSNPELTTREKHIRVCYVVLENDTPDERKRVETEIKSMPNYFAEYDTIVHFVSHVELIEKHSKMPHGGFVLTSGSSASWNKFLMEFSLKLESNPEFTGNILVAYARAAYRLRTEGVIGAQTVFDIAPKYFSPKTNEELRRTML